ncbi:FAD-dependent oxidoreductase, partial [Psychrobacter sp. GW64-MNA-CIBAN-0177]
SITIIGQNQRVMGNIISETVSNALIKLHKDNGIKFVLDATVNAINGNEHSDSATKVGSITLADGEQIAADIVILGTGVLPRTKLLGEA